MNLKRGACYSSTPQKIHRPSGQGIVIPITSKEKIKRSSAIEKNVLKDLSIEKKLIGDKQIPLHSYNYSYIKDRLQTVYDQKVSVPTIIDRAKKKGFYLKKHNGASTTERS
jgi:hypothetical protein